MTEQIPQVHHLVGDEARCPLVPAARRGSDEALLHGSSPSRTAPSFELLGLEPAALAGLVGMQYQARQAQYRSAHPGAVEYLICRERRPARRQLLARRHARAAAGARHRGAARAPPPRRRPGGARRALRAGRRRRQAGPAVGLAPERPGPRAVPVARVHRPVGRAGRQPASRRPGQRLPGTAVVLRPRTSAPSRRAMTDRPLSFADFSARVGQRFTMRFSGPTRRRGCRRRLRGRADRVRAQHRAAAPPRRST